METPALKNLFEDVTNGGRDEFIETLAQSSGDFTIERIVSEGHNSPSGFWYDQDTTEWVFLLTGSATLEFESPSKLLDLNPGDWLRIEPNRKHRVAQTSAVGKTVWLAIHVRTEL